MSVYARLNKGVVTPKYRKTPSLKRLHRYELYDIKSEVNKFNETKEGKSVMKTVVYFRECGMPFYHYLGQEYDDLDSADLEIIKGDIAKGKAPAVVFYGFNGSSKVLKLVGCDEDIDQDLVSTLKMLEEAESSFEGEPSTKRARQE